MSLQTLNDILLAVCQSRRDRVMLQRQVLGWVPISSTEIYRGVVGVARALESWGIGKGDRVAILSENRPEWTITDFATLALGAVTVPIYSTQTAEQTAFILRDCGARVVAVSTKHQLEKVLTVQRHTSVERIVVMDAIETAHAVHMQGLMLQGPTAFDWARRPGDNHLHLRHYRNSEGSDADPWEHSVEYRVFAGWIRRRDKRRRGERIFSATFPCDGAARGPRAALPRGGAGVLS